MFVGARVLLRCRRVKAALMGESRFADIGCLRIGRAVQPVVQHSGQAHQLGKARFRNPRFIAKLQNERRDQGNQVGIAASLAKTVDRALYLPRAGANGRQRIGHRHAGIIMAMDAETDLRECGMHGADDLEHLVRQRAAIRVAENNPGGTAFMRRANTVERIVRIVLVPVEEMFAVEHRFTTTLGRGGNRLADHLKIFVERRVDRRFDMEVPGLADKAGGRNLGVEDGVQTRVIGGAAAATARHPEGDHACLRRLRRVTEKGVVCRVGPRPAALDVIDPDFVKRCRNGNLIGFRKVDATGLTTVAKRRVEQPDPVIAHSPVPRSGTCRPANLVCPLTKLMPKG